MQTGRILKTGLAVGVVANVYDFALNMYVLPLMGPPPPFMNDLASLPIMWLVIADFVAALVFIGFFDKVRVAFGPGAKGGATYGLYAGVLINFPLWIVMHFLVKDWSYGVSWTWICTGILWTLIMGAVGGLVYDKAGPAKA